MKKLPILVALLLMLCLVCIACKQPSDSESSETNTSTAPVTDAPTDPADTATAPASEPMTKAETETATEPSTETPSQTAAEATDDTSTDTPSETETQTETEPSLYMRTDSRTGFKNWSFDTFRINGSAYFAEDGNAGEKLAAQDDRVEFASGIPQESVTFRGWIGFTQSIDQFGYIIGRADPVFGEFAAETEDGVKAAGGEFASRFEILVPLHDLKEGTYKISAVVRLKDGKLVQLYEISVVLPKDYGKDITKTFRSDVNGQKTGDDLMNTDLFDFFNIVYGLSEPHCVMEIDGEKVYAMGGINEMYGSVNGRYAFTVDTLSCDPTAMFFVRGVHVLNPAPDAGIQHIINNYYETDGADMMGGGGIWARVDGDRLTLMIKVYDPANPAGVANKFYQFTVDSTVITLADDGRNTVYVLAGDKLITTITLSGSVTYDAFSYIDPNVPFAARAEIVTDAGVTETIENTLVTVTPTQVGIAVRPGTIRFRSISVVPFSDVTIPSELWRPMIRANLVKNATATASCEENATNVTANAIDGNEGTRWGALPKGEAYLTVDLGDVYLIDTIRVYFENTVLPWSILISTDGETYTSVYEGNAGGTRTEKITLDPVNARYVRFLRGDDTGKENCWFSIYEIEIFGEKTQSAS